MQSVLIHCQPTLLDYIKENNMNWKYSSKFGVNEIDVIVEDINYNPQTDYIDPDVHLYDHYGIDYDQVNCIELAWVSVNLDGEDRIFTLTISTISTDQFYSLIEV